MNKINLPLRIFGIIAVIFLLMPTVVIIPMSFSSGRTLKFPPPGYSLRWYENLFTSPLWTDSAISSLQVGILTAILATILGTIAALGLTRGQFPAKNGLCTLAYSWINPGIGCGPHCVSSSICGHQRDGKSTNFGSQFRDGCG